MARTLSIKAQTLHFRHKAIFAKIVKDEWTCFRIIAATAYSYEAVHIDPKRGVKVRMLINTKSKGVGAGECNVIHMKFEELGKPLTIADLNVYFRQYKVAAKIA